MACPDAKDHFVHSQTSGLERRGEQTWKSQEKAFQEVVSYTVALMFGERWMGSLILYCCPKIGGCPNNYIS